MGYSIESNTVKTTISSLKLPWSFAIITDSHMGRNVYSSREEGGLKEIPVPNYLVDRLTEALENIKKLKDKENIQFLVVLGDISDSGEEGELKKRKEILDKFEGAEYNFNKKDLTNCRYTVIFNKMRRFNCLKNYTKVYPQLKKSYPFGF